MLTLTKDTVAIIGRFRGRQISTEIGKFFTEIEIIFTEIEKISTEIEKTSTEIGIIFSEIRKIGIA